MQKKIAMKWVKALRSGKYEQAKDRLKTQDAETGVTGHCCLGVLGEICGLDDAKLLSNETLLYDHRIVCGIASDEGSARLKNGHPVRVRIRNETGVIEFSSLAEANDSGISFKRIATYIKNNYKKL